MGTLAAPGYATQVDIFFNDNPQDVIEIGGIEAYNPLFPDADYTFYIVWDELNTIDQQRLLDFVDQYGGVVPFAGPVDGFQTINYNGTALGGNSTGLDATAFGPSTLVHLFKTPKAGGDATGLNEFNNDGLQEITKFITRAADSAPAPLGGKFFVINSPTPTSYYVWYNVLGQSEVTNLNFSSIPANGSHLLIDDPVTGFYVNFVDEGTHEIFDADFTGLTYNSFSGGDHFTFAANGNDYYVWFNKPIKENFDVGFGGGTGAALVEGTYWTFSDDTTDFYVWYDRPALATSFTVDTTGVDGTSIVGGEHFVLSTPSTDYYVWFTLGGVGVDPAPGGTGLLVNVLATDTEANVSEKVEAAIRSTNDFLVTDTSQTVIGVTSNEAGVPLTPAADVDAGVTVVVSQAGRDAGIDPAPGGTGIRVELADGNTDQDALNATLLAIDVANVTPRNNATDNLDITVNVAGNVTDAADVDSGLAYVSVDVQGAASSVDPAPGGTGFVVLVEPADTSASLAAKTNAAIVLGVDGSTLYTPGSSVVRVISSSVADETDAADVDSGVAITVVQQGFENTSTIDATLEVDVVGGVVTGVSITDAGSGYIDGTGFTTLLLTTAGGGDGFAEITYDVVNGQVTNVSVSVGGSTYTNGLGQPVTDMPVSEDNDPAVGGRTRIAVPYVRGVSGTTLSELIDSVVTEVDADVAFGAVRSGNSVVVTNTTVGAALNAADVDSGVTVTTANQGVDGSTDPAPGGTGIQVDLSSTETATSVALKTKDAIVNAASVDFLVTAIGNTLTVKNVDVGVAADSTNGDTSFGITKVQEGTNPTARNYTFTHYNGGAVDAVSVPGTTATFTDLLTSINGQMTNTVASIDGNGNLLFTTSGSGPTEYVFIKDGDLFGALNDSLRFEAPVVGAGTEYAVSIKVDGVVQNLVIAGEDAATFTDLAAALTAALTGATAAVDGDDNITITSLTAGNGGSIEVLHPVGDQVFPQTTGFIGYNVPRNGADDFVDSLFVNDDVSGNVMFETFAVRGIGSKPPVGNTNNSSTSVYYDGADWVRLVDDTPI